MPETDSKWETAGLWSPAGWCPPQRGHDGHRPSHSRGGGWCPNRRRRDGPRGWPGRFGSLVQTTFRYWVPRIRWSSASLWGRSCRHLAQRGGHNVPGKTGQRLSTVLSHERVNLVIDGGLGHVAGSLSTPLLRQPTNIRAGAVTERLPHTVHEH